MEEKTLVTAYVVKRYSNGDIDVEDAKLEGTTEMVPAQIYKDIEDVAKTIELKRVENAAYAGVYRFYQSVQEHEASQNDAPAVEG